MCLVSSILHYQTIIKSNQGGRLYCKEDEIVPLTGASATVKILDYCAEVTIKQRYENKQSHPIEAVYEFPLDSKAAIHSFTAEIDDKIIIGKIQEKEKAMDIYSDAISSGHGAYLLKEKDEPDMFTCSVGNLPPGKEVLIVISYVIELELSEDMIELVLRANPYAPNGKNKEKFALPSDRKGGKYSKKVGYGLKIDVALDMTSPIAHISSPTNPIKFEFGDKNSVAHVKLASQDEEDGVPLTQDFRLLISLKEPYQPISRIEQNDKGELVVMAALHPEMKEDEQPISEMIFVVDRSGSMKKIIGIVQDTLHIFLRSLPMGTLFNIIGFGGSTEELFTASKEYNEESFLEALKHVNRMEANLGGTNLLKPLKQVFSEKAKKGIARQVFILTDGEVEDMQQCIDEVRSNSSTTRVFTFGIGNEVSIPLVTRIAEAGEGKYELIEGKKDIDVKVMRQLNRAMCPAFTELRIDWSGLDVKQSPFHFPPLFGDGRLLVYGVISQLPSEPVTAKLTANSPHGSFETAIVIDPSKCLVKGNVLHTLAARSMIRDLQEGRSYMHDKEMVTKPSQDDVNQEIVKISQSSGVLSRLTAFVGVEKRTNVASEEAMRLYEMGVRNPASRCGPMHGRGRGGFGLGAGGSRGGRGGSRGGGLGGLSIGGRGGRGGSLGDLVHSRGGRGGGWSVRGGGVVSDDRGDPKVRLDRHYNLSQSPMESRSLLPTKRSFDSNPVEENLKEESEANEVELVKQQENLIDEKKQKFVTSLIKTQQANGSFTFHSLRMIAPGVNSAILKSELPKIKNIPESLLEAITITAIVCHYLSTVFADQKVSWNLLVKKALWWVNKECQNTEKVDWNKLSASFISKHAKSHK